MFLCCFGLAMFNFYLGSKLEDKKKIITFLKDEIEELSKPKDFPDIKVDSSLAIKKLNQDILYLEINNNELKQQLVELENQYKGLSAKVSTLLIINTLLVTIVVKLVYSA